MGNKTKRQISIIEKEPVTRVRGRKAALHHLDRLMRDSRKAQEAERYLRKH